MGMVLHTYKKATAESGGYGKLFNFFAITDSRNICAEGAHVLTQTEWNALITYLGGETVAGGKLKETGTTHWNSPNTGATNEYGFNAIGGGYREDTDGVFHYLKIYAYYWASTSIGIYILINSDETFSNNEYQPQYGCSVRAAKDSTDLSEGQTGSYTGNDGQTYWTKCINGVEYIVENLRETKFRDGTLIPEITDAGQWAACSSSPSIGTVMGGGKLFYKSYDETWGLVVNPNFVSQDKGFRYDPTGMTLTGIGDGVTNFNWYYEHNFPSGNPSEDLNDVVYIVKQDRSGGYDDWFIPSKAELEEILYAVPEVLVEHPVLTDSYIGIGYGWGEYWGWDGYDNIVGIKDHDDTTAGTIYAVRRVNLYPDSAWCYYNNDHNNE